MINILTPNQLENIPNNIVELFQQLEEFIIIDFARRVKKTGEITSSAEWQKQQASLYGIKNIENKVASILKLSDDQIESLFPNIALTSFKAEMEIYKQAKLNTIDYKSKAIQDYIKAAIKQTKGDMENITQSLGFAEVQNGHVVYNDIAKFYQKELNLAQIKISTGVQDYNSAIKQAVKKISSSGLRYVNYESGWSNRIDVATRRAIITGTHQMTQQMSDLNMEKLIPNEDDRFVEVTSHENCRPSHLSFQGRVFKVVGSNKDYENLAEATGLGSVTGLKGANCRHDYYPFIPGVSVRTYTDKQLEQMEKDSKETFNYKDKEYTPYEATQYQREIETSIRQTKRELIGYKESGLDADFKASSIKLQQQRREYKEFSNKANLRIKDERHQVVNFDRSIAQQSSNAAKK